MDADGGNQRRITNAPGYDGGAFFSFDNQRLVFRASRPKGEALEDYRRLLAQGLVRPSHLEIYTSNVDGTDVRKITDNGAANFGPYFHPDGRRIIFVSNLNDPEGRNFDLFLINDDGSGLEQITHNPTFDGFPMFSHDGKKLVFASNRNNQQRGETNVFIADWID
jgi:Tol biopolymer transport system component